MVPFDDVIMDNTITRLSCLVIEKKTNNINTHYSLRPLTKMPYPQNNIDILYEIQAAAWRADIAWRWKWISFISKLQVEMGL